MFSPVPGAGPFLVLHYIMEYIIWFRVFFAQHRDSRRFGLVCRDCHMLMVCFKSSFLWSSILASMIFAVRGFCSRVGGHISRVVGHSSGVGEQSPRVGGHSSSKVVSLPVVVPQMRLLDRSVRPVWLRLHRSGSCAKCLCIL